MDDLCQNLLATLKKPSASLDSKLNLFNSLKSNIKHQRVPENAQSAALECIRFAIASQSSSALVTTGFSTLGHLVKRLVLQGQVHIVFSNKCHIVPTLVDRMGDSKESYRVAAVQNLCDLWSTKPEVVEKAVRESAILGTNVRAKETGMSWVAKMHSEQNLQFRSFVPAMVECLDHADGNVRESAKANIINLFKDAPDRAQADLKRQLIAHDVRKSIASHILCQLHIPLPSELGAASILHSSLRPETPAQDLGMADMASRCEDTTLPPSATTSRVEPSYVNSQRELEDIFRAMPPCFEGRENESNWMARDNSVLKLRQLLQGNAPADFQVCFLAGIKGLLDGILKVVNTLRTTMSTNGCHLVQELAQVLGPAIDPMVEILLQNLVKVCSATKNIAAQNGNATMDVILHHVSYNLRLMQHIWAACQDKNVQPRIFASGWLKTVLKRQTHNRAQFEHSGGLELAEKVVKKGLNDPNPKVREGMRGTYWMLAQSWPQRSESIFSTLDPKSKQLLEKDPANPNASQVSFTSSVGATSSNANPRAATSNSRSSLKETIAAQKKASMASRRLPERPNSAMANLSPMKQGGTLISRANHTQSASNSTRAPPPPPPQSASKAAINGSSNVTHGSLMSGPVRRPRKAEVQRPATADPYANRKTLRGETPPSRSPANSPVRHLPKGTTSTRAPVRNGPSHAAAAGFGRSSQTNSPFESPAKTRPKTIHVTDAGSMFTQPHQMDITSPNEDNFTMVAPNGKAPHGSPVGKSARPLSSDSPASMVDDDNFTLVMLRTEGPKERVSNGQIEVDNDGHVLPGSGRPHSPMRDDAEKPVMVYEDPQTAQSKPPSFGEPAKDVLEELPVNNRSYQPTMNDAISHARQDNGHVSDEVRLSPTKKKNATALDSAAYDRAEVLNNRRLLSSGIERLRAKTLDPHGFRRLQELIRSSAKDPDVDLTRLLEALLDYIEAPNETLKINATKVQSLKSQALATIRMLASSSVEDAGIRNAFGHALCSVLRAKETTESISYTAIDLEKTADEIIKHAEDQSVDCVVKVLDLAEKQANSSDTAGHRRMMTMTLVLLSKLLKTVRTRALMILDEDRERMGQLAVQFLEDGDADVRRADVEFCVELGGSYGQDNKDGFWRMLQGARETQLNLVAYYLARRERRV